MKKTLLYSMLILSLGFTACTEDFNEGIAAPQKNEQEEALKADFQITSSGEAYVLPDLASDEITLATIATPPVLPEGATVKYDLYLSATEDFAKIDTVEVVGDYKVTKEDLQALVEKNYGKKPEARDVYMLACAYVKMANTTGYMLKSNVIKFTVTPQAPLIESAYYLYGASTSWAKDNVLQFSHSDKDVYDDPIFTIMVPAVTDGSGNVSDYWFKIASQSSVDAEAANAGDLETVGILGAAVDGGLDGKLIATDPKAMKIPASDYKFIKITLNMMEYTYEVETLDASPYLWVPGEHNGWGDAFANPGTLYSASMDMKYSGFIYLNGDFKLTAQANWGPVEYNFDNVASKSDNILAGGGSNFKISEAGFYYLTIDLNKKTGHQSRYTLYQKWCPVMVRGTGLEPVTSCTSSRCSTS